MPEMPLVFRALFAGVIAGCVLVGALAIISTVAHLLGFFP